MAVTRKKVKVVGTETYIKQDTGELREIAGN
ncbi:replication/maintenance protein RepL [Selenomonas infelix]|nr:replication/maintenance protein RepL [Selenomonas infelix]